MAYEAEHRNSAAKYQAKADELKKGPRKEAMQNAADAHNTAADAVAQAAKCEKVAESPE
jgi:hypothetical protein